MTQDLKGLRKGVDEARAASVAAQAKLAAAAAALAHAKRTGQGDITAAQAAAEAATAAAKAAQATLGSRSGALNEAIGAVVGTTVGGGAAAVPPAAPAEVPVALLPVGIETRFRGDTLMVRVIPDQIHVEDHEPELIQAEVDAGRAFWRAVWRGGTIEPAATAAEQAAWADLVAAAGDSRRAAWVADQCAPTGGVRPADPVPAGQSMADPPFPDPPLRPDVWSQPAMARCLPDRFVAIAYRRTGSGGTAGWVEIARATGAPLGDAVQLGFDPTADAPEVDDSGPVLPDGMRWIADPEAAEKAGLLLKLNLPAGTATVDRLVVLGTLATLDPADSAGRLADLLAGHHHSDGLEVPAIGTPTNNTAVGPSGFLGRDDPAASFLVERRTPAPPDGSDGGLLARALGIPADVLRGVAGSNASDQAAAGRMNALVWPAAMGYWFDSLVQPGPSDAAITDLRAHAVAMVRGRGPLPPLRVGRQPYGVLPVTSLAGWKPQAEPSGVVELAGFLKDAYPWWLDGVAEAPVIRAGRDPDQGLLDALGQLPVSNTVGVRSMVGANVSYLPFGLATGGPVGEGLAAEANRQRYLALLGFRALGVTGFPYLGQLVANADPVPTLRLPYTVDKTLTADQQAAAWKAVTTYLNALRGRKTNDFKAEDPKTLTALLTLVARRAVMLERIRAGLLDTKGVIAGGLVEAHLRSDAAPVVSAALISTTATLKIGQTLSAPAAILAGSVTQANGSQLRMPDYLDKALVISGIVDPVRHSDYAATVDAAEAAAKLDPDRAALMLGEALDIASHRIDAWITSLATRRLSDLRAKTPAGITIGAYGAVEELARRPALVPVAAPPPGAPAPLFAEPSGGGYIHAPSQAQAATAAVLRAGHLSHAARDPNSAALSIDLTSARVRAALGLLDGVRQGQSLGALLGYQVERQLHELGAHTAVEAVRRLAPPPVVTAAGTPEGLPPRAVCDGLALSRLPRATVLAATQAAGADNAAVGKALDALGDAVDALADLLLAESVHQIVKGNPDRAAAALDTLNHGEGAITDPDVAKTPRTGTRLTQRVAIAIGADAPPAPGWPTDGIRARTEPLVAAWAGHLLGNPDGVTVRLNLPAGAAPMTFPLAELGLGALDLVYEPLAARALRHGRQHGAPEASAFDAGAPGLAELLATADLVRGVLSRARPGTGYDLGRPQDGGSPDGGTAGGVPLPDVDHGARQGRLDAARDRLKAAAAALPDLAPGAPAPAEAGLLATLDALACFGLAPGGDPGRAPDADALIALKSAAQARLAQAEAAPGDAAALFGAGFPVLALAGAAFPAAVNAALALDPVAAAPAELLAPLGGAAQALDSWLETTGRSRPELGRLADLLLAARLRGTAAPATLRAMQLPAEPFPSAAAAQRGQWIGLRFPAELGPDPVTAFVLHRLGSLDAAAGMALLVVDEFTEIVPGAGTTTAVAFGYDAPGARPPQSVLLAVPPVAGTPWTIDALAEVVGETLDLAKARMVDLSSVAWAGRFLPALYFTDGDISNGVDLPMKALVTAAAARFAAVQP